MTLRAVKQSNNSLAIIKPSIWGTITDEVEVISTCAMPGR